MGRYIVHQVNEIKNNVIERTTAWCRVVLHIMRGCALPPLVLEGGL